MPFPRHRAALLFGAALPAVLLAALALTACNKQELSPEQARVQKGRTLYTLRCASCHHPADPGRDGSLGPAIAGAGRDLLEARILRAEYPPGYAPKRSTHLMPKLTATPEELDALHAFLNAP
jgi:mono/diheme cytochrome c family protein